MQIGQLAQFQVSKCVGVVDCYYENVDFTIFFVGCQFCTIAKNYNVAKFFLYGIQEMVVKVFIGPWKDKVVRLSIVREFCQ